MDKETKKPTLEEAQAWAERRKRPLEEVTVLECPCCSSYLAVFHKSLEYTVPVVVDTNPATQGQSLESLDRIRNF